MTSTGRVPLWLIATFGGIAALTVVGLFFYGSYSGVGFFL
jgi:photosystem II PsbJ protein